MGVSACCMEREKDGVVPIVIDDVKDRVDKSEDHIEVLTADIKDKDAKIKSLNSDIADLGKDIAQLEKDIKTNDDKRAKDYVEYQAKAKDLTEAIASCDEAIDRVESECVYVGTENFTEDIAQLEKDIKTNDDKRAKDYVEYQAKAKDLTEAIASCDEAIIEAITTPATAGAAHKFVTDVNDARKSGSGFNAEGPRSVRQMRAVFHKKTYVLDGLLEQNVTWAKCRYAPKKYVIAGN